MASLENYDEWGGCSDLKERNTLLELNVSRRMVQVTEEGKLMPLFAGRNKLYKRSHPKFQSKQVPSKSITTSINCLQSLQVQHKPPSTPSNSNKKKDKFNRENSTKPAIEVTDYLSENKFLDYIIEGEGELPFIQFLKAWDERARALKDP